MGEEKLQKRGGNGAERKVLATSKLPLHQQYGLFRNKAFQRIRQRNEGGPRPHGKGGKAGSGKGKRKFVCKQEGRTRRKKVTGKDRKIRRILGRGRRQEGT